MQETDWPTTFSYTEKELDTHFIGELEIHHIDDYDTIKAGSTSKSAVVRSRLDFNRGVIKLVAVIPDKFGANHITMDGSSGFYGKISERAIGYNEELLSVTFLYIKLLSAESVSKGYQMTSDGYKVWRAEAEIDDVVFNQDNTYSYPLYYFAKGKGSPRLAGMYTEIPIAHFNHYVHMRDLWYRDYRGSQTAHQPGD